MVSKWLKKLNARLKKINDSVSAWNDKRLRHIDLVILWPAIRRNADMRLPDDPHDALELAREAFIKHMSCDPPWRRIADEWTEEQLGDWVRSTLV